MQKIITIATGGPCANLKSHTEAIDTILSGKVHSYSVEFGPASGAIETTDDGK